MPYLPDAYLNRDDLLLPGGRNATVACEAFLRQHEDDLLSLTGSQLVLAELQRLADGLDAALDPELPQPGRFRTSVDRHPLLKAVNLTAGRVRGELALVRYVDNYLTYLAEILREVLRIKPEVLMSSQSTITVKEALEHQSIDDLRGLIADRAVTALSYAGLADVDDYFKRRLGLRLFQDDALRTYVSEAVLIRNLLTHRRGVVDERAIRSGLPRERYPVGRRVELAADEPRRVIAAAIGAIIDLDERVAAKFGLDMRPHQPTLPSPTDTGHRNGDAPHRPRNE